jgi:ubiquinone/menaquinone biosynthesis C-methylase UbiE
VTQDMWSRPEEWDAEQAHSSALILEQRAAAEDQVRLRAALIEMGQVAAGQTVLEVGSGTGPLLVDLARAVGPEGRAIGIEPQPHLATTARGHLDAQGMAFWAEVHQGRAEALTLPDAVVDLCVAQTVFLHLTDETRARVLAEMIRVTKPGGHVLTVDQDMSTFVVDHPDSRLTARLLQANLSSYEQPAMGRLARATFLDAGLQDVRVQVLVQAETGSADFLVGSCERMARGVAARGGISTDELERWLEQLGRVVESGRFFASLNYYACVGRRSGSSS